jgi:hypothetical protein
VLRIEAGFPAGSPPADLAFGDLRVRGDLGSWSTGPGSRVQLVPTLITMAGELLAWCRSGGGPAALHSFEAKRLLTLDDADRGRVRVSGPDGPLHVAADAREVCLAFHTATMDLVDRHPDLSWTVARDDFWAVMADFRVQCLPGLVRED